jgi:hypothetical protein
VRLMSETILCTMVEKLQEVQKRPVILVAG